MSDSEIVNSLTNGLDDLSIRQDGTPGLNVEAKEFVPSFALQSHLSNQYDRQTVMNDPPLGST